MIILVFWCMWRHRNGVVFNGAVASHAAFGEKIKEEYDRWRLAKLLCENAFSFPEHRELLWQLEE
jgi:hypothetical protein